MTFIGALAVLIGKFPYNLMPFSVPTLVSVDAVQMATLVSNGSYGILAVCITVLLGYCLANDVRVEQSIEISPHVVAVVSLVNFFVYARMFSPDNQAILGTSSVFAAISIAIFSMELFLYLFRVRLLRFELKNPDFDIDLNLAIRSIIPAITTVVCFFAVAKAIYVFSPSVGSWVGHEMAALNNWAGSQLPGFLIYEFFAQTLWFFGIHGAHALQNVYTALFDSANITGDYSVINGRFLSLYAHMSGTGSTIGLLIAVFLCVKTGSTRQVAKVAILPSCFNINEIVVYGIPIAFNPVFLVPFILVPLVQVAFAYPFVHYGYVAMDVAISPWMTPPILSGTINSGSWRGGALQCANLVLSTLIYYPFVRWFENMRVEEHMRDMQTSLATIEANNLARNSLLDRRDSIGYVSRRLLREFKEDLDTGRVYLCYQPQHDGHGKVIGAEALLRWRHHQYGNINPSVICPLTEESKDIIVLGRWVIHAACQQLRDWELAGVTGLQMSVNLSALQLEDPTLLEYIDACVAENNINPRQLAIELTETQHVSGSEQSDRFLHGLMQRGIHLEMDDFGMGYSSMLYIRRFHFSAIKLDGVLTKNILTDVNCKDIINSVVVLARARGIRIVAEYVETQEQQALLARLGCDVFQGYYYSQALPGDECLAYFHKHRAQV